MSPVIEVSKKRLAWLKKLTLARGSHEKPNGKACVMEAVAYVAGEKWSDHPECASRVITSFCIKLNDQWGDERRQKLKPFVLRIAGTAADLATERKRAYMCADWAVRECLPLALEAAKIPEWPETLRALPEVVDEASAQVACAKAREARKAALKKKYAYAADAAAYAAYADAAAAYDAAAAADAAADAADAADAAYDAAAAAYAADAAYDAAARTKADASVLALLDRLIRVTEVSP